MLFVCLGVLFGICLIYIFFYVCLFVCYFRGVLFFCVFCCVVFVCAFCSPILSFITLFSLCVLVLLDVVCFLV